MAEAGVISDAEVAKIVLPPDELSAFRFATHPEAQELLPRCLAQRVEQCLNMLEHQTPGTYLEQLVDSHMVFVRSRASRTGIDHHISTHFFRVTNH